MDVFGRVPTCLAHDDPVAILLPLEHRARASAELAANFDRDRDLPLSCDAGLRECHAS